MNTGAKSKQYIISKGTGRYLYLDQAVLKFQYNGSTYAIDSGTYFNNLKWNFISLQVESNTFKRRVNSAGGTISISEVSIP